MNKGFAPVAIIIIIAVVLVTGVLISKNYQRSDTSSTPQPTMESTAVPTLTPSPSPRSSIRPTVRPTITPTPTASTGCSRFKPEDGLTSITITLKEKDGKPLVGDWIVKIKPTGSCPGILPQAWGSQINEVIRQPNYTYTSPGLHPGQFRVDINYHITGDGFDWDGTSGTHSREVTVSN